MASIRWYGAILCLRCGRPGKRARDRVPQIRNPSRRHTRGDSPPRVKPPLLENSPPMPPLPEGEHGKQI